MARLKQIFGVVLVFLSFHCNAAELLLLSKWAVDLGKFESPIDRYKTAELSGITLDGKYFYVATPQGQIQKRSLQTGEKEWGTSLEGESPTTWTVSNSEIFGGDSKGNFYCLRTQDGSIKWKASTKGVFFSKALVGEKQVWVSTSNGTLQSFDRETGQWLWQQADPQATSLSLWSSQGPILFQGAILSGFPSAILQAFDSVSGKTLWKESFTSTLLAGIESFNDLKSFTAKSEYLIASSFNGDMKAWKAQGPAKKLLWQKKVSLYAPVSFETDGRVLFSARDGSVQALDLDSGFVAWKNELSSGLGSQPASLGGNVWVGSSTGSIYVFSNSGNQILKSKGYESAIWNPPVLLGEEEALVLTSQGILRRVRLVKS